MKTTCETVIFGDVVRFRADWADASSNIARHNPSTDQWLDTGYQVADFGHDHGKFIAEDCRETMLNSGEHPDDHADELAAEIRRACQLVKCETNSDTIDKAAGNE
jgi:hypothetical protein